MKTKLFLSILFLMLAGCQRIQPSGSVSSGQAHWAVYFSPHGGCTEAIVSEIEKTRRSIRVQAYSFTSAPIARALVDAKRHGVDIEIILDKSNESAHYSPIDFFTHAGIPVRIDDAHSIAHNKVMVIDDQTVITGSFNFTRAAEERNAENLLIITDPALASRYTKNWKTHAAHSRLVQ